MSCETIQNIDRKLIKNHFYFGATALAFAVAGQVIRNPNLMGELSAQVPTLVKNHLSNLFDIPAVAGAAAGFMKGVVRPERQIPLSIAAAMAFGTGWEVYSLHRLNRTSFDWADQTLYLTVGAAMLMHHYWKRGKMIEAAQTAQPTAP